MSKTFSFTEYNTFKSNGIINSMVLFIPAITINCNPAYVKGLKDSCWIKYRAGQKPKTKQELEIKLGMSILAWD